MPIKVLDYDEKDNPFRPEGELAKEAIEDARKFKYKSALNDQNQTHPNTSNTNQHEQVINHTELSPLKHDASPVTTSDQVNVSMKNESNDTKDALAQTQEQQIRVDEQTCVNQATNDMKSPTKSNKKKDKTKPKCGCLLS